VDTEALSSMCSFLVSQRLGALPFAYLWLAGSMVLVRLARCRTYCVAYIPIPLCVCVCPMTCKVMFGANDSEAKQRGQEMRRCNSLNVCSPQLHG
jgi:hypothetical protein